MKKILFPTDFSDAAYNAFVYALRLADALDAEIITLHVYELPQLDYMEVPVYLLDVYEITELSNFENYQHHIPALRDIADQHKLAHIKISNVLESGNLINSIAHISKQENIDYIVMGTKGASGMAATFLGSVTEKVMRQSGITVLAIPDNCTFSTVKNILFTTKYKPEDHSLLRKVTELAAVFESHINCLYIVSSDDEMDQRRIDAWKQGIDYAAISFRSIPSSNVEQSIIDFIESHQIGLLAMPLHSHSFFESLFHVSLSKKLAHHVKIPILGLHA